LPPKIEQVQLILHGLYHLLHKKEYIHSDPIQFPLSYKEKEDQEVIAFIAALVSLGRVDQIKIVLTKVKTILGPHPFSSLKKKNWLNENLTSLSYRFFKEKDFYHLFLALGEILNKAGSLEAFVLGENTLFQGLKKIHSLLIGQYKLPPILMSDPTGPSASKRLWMFLRWMIRKDEIDLGLWKNIGPSELLYPVDTHILKWGRLLGITSRKSADLRASEEITQGIRPLCPEDPVRYDFSLTRVGILGLLGQWTLDEVHIFLKNKLRADN